MYLPRVAETKVRSLAAQFKAVAVIGPRQSGKTTLCRRCFPDKPYVSLENPEQRAFAIEDPRGFLASLPAGAILDEIQRTPHLLSWLQQRLDEESRPGTFILTGSNNFLLLESLSQSLAGRAAYLDLLPFSLEELAPQASLEDQLWQGGYPAVRNGQIPAEDWFPAYLRTYVERDVRQIRNIENLFLFEKFISLCAGRVGQLLNYSSLSVELGIDVKTVQAWIGVLQASYILYLLPPYYRNFSKRIIKSPKLYFCDTGLACHLLRIDSPAHLVHHAQRGALFENYAVTELLKNRLNRGLRPNLYFWRDQSGHEVGLLLDEGDQTLSIELKSGQTIQPSFFKGLQYYRSLSGAERGRLYYGGDQTQLRSDGTEALPWTRLAEG
jgi:hypothetical protein